MKHIFLLFILLMSPVAFAGPKLKAADVDTLITDLFVFHKSALADNGFTAEPSVYIDEDSQELNAHVNTIRAMRTDEGLIDFYELYIGGGILRASKTKTVFMTVVAHELGHLVGQGPKDDSQKSAVEGEADYQSGRLLVEFIKNQVAQNNKSLLEETSGIELETQIANIYNLKPENTDDLIKVKVLAASYTFLSHLHPKEIVVDCSTMLTAPAAKKTLDDYPSPQVRWQTMVAGVLGQPRPSSWAAPSDFK